MRFRFRTKQGVSDKQAQSLVRLRCNQAHPGIETRTLREPAAARTDAHAHQVPRSRLLALFQSRPLLHLKGLQKAIGLPDAPISAQLSVSPPNVFRSLTSLRSASSARTRALRGEGR